ncbi:hypothetical protein L1277_002146 [Okibacterium sp. HSC-33S16]|uniref:hypothetical protein n=1 Tax=Okibacterium sp. HSC-33S16 TaxID=2910965 RepID=UPI0020A0641A|nr:hypothetical protein [Okibacterium sp. HSC-33S16]MCP2032047.1 hypothetical protein [Okibacterium sp. HSC-33S16]
MSKITRVVVTFFAAIALLFVGAVPALADHNAGADLDEGGDCYYGQLLSGPPKDIRTTDYTLIRHGDSLLVVCYFSLPRVILADEDCLGCGSDIKDDWYAPSRPAFFTNPHACVPPGAMSPGGDWPNGEMSRWTDAKIVFYRTHAVLTCFWPDDPTDDPGAPGGPPLP